MPAIQPQRATPSTLDAVIAQVRDAFGAMADATPIMVGAQYLEDFGAGAAPRVLFVPETKGKLGPPLELGDAARITHACDVYVRAAESPDDFARFGSAYALLKRVMSCLAVAATGRIEWGTIEDDSPSDVPSYGCDLSISFSYTSAVRHDPARWGIAAATADDSDYAPTLPPGLPAIVDTVDATVIPQE